MTMLVTGATGFIGSHLVHALNERGEKVISMVHDTPIWNKWLKESVMPTIKVQGDIRNPSFLKRVLNQYEVSQVYHLAAQSIVKRAWKDPVNTFDINVMGTVTLLEVCRQLEIERIMIQSTDKVYGNQMDATPMSQLQPTEPYGSSKICEDVAAQTFIQTYDMPIVISRCCNVYGYDWNNRIIPNTIRVCMSGGSPIIYKNDISTRQYIYVKQAVDSFIELMKQRVHVPGIFNIAMEEVKTQEEVVLEVLKHFPDLKPQYIEKPALKEIRSQSMVPSNLKIWCYTFEHGIKLTIEAFKEYGF